MDFRGVYTAIITPFKDGEIDYKSVVKTLDLQIKAKVTGVLLCGSTGEGSTISCAEKLEFFEFCKNHIAARIKIIASVGTNDTVETIHMAKKVEMLGVDGLMVVAPYYNKAPQEGLYQHFAKIHAATTLPILIYNNPGRTSIDISDEVISRLATLGRFALKDSTYNLSRPLALRNIHHADLVMISGDDMTSFAFYVCGGQGICSVAGNVFPEIFVKIYNLWVSGKVVEAAKLHDSLVPLLVAMNLDTNPITVKYAASLLDLCHEDVRLPLVTTSADKKAKIKSEVDKLNKLK